MSREREQQPFRWINIENKVRAGYIGSFLLLVLISVVSYDQINRLEHTEKRVQKIQETRVELGHLNVSLLNSESSLRIYLDTGNKPYKEQYTHFLNELSLTKLKLSNLLANDKAQMNNFARLTELIDFRLNTHAKYLLLYNNRDVHSAIETLSQDGLTGTMQSLRSLFKTMDNIETERLKINSTTHAHQEHVMVIMLMTTLTLALVIFAVSFIGIRKEIKTNIKARQKLEVNATRLATILSTVADGIITISEEGIVESLNPAAEDIFGYTATEVIGNNIKMLMPEPYHSQHDNYLKQYCNTGKSEIIGASREVVGRHKSGSAFPMQLSVSEMYLGNQRYFTGLVKNITDRKLAEEEAAAIQHNLLEAQRIARIGDWRWDISTGELTWSDEIYRIFGRSADEFEATFDNFIAAIHPDDHPALLDAIDVTMKEENIPFILNYSVVLPDGCISYVHANGEVIRNSDGQPVMMLGTLQDITESKLAEMELVKAKDAAEHANQAKNSFLATMSHEIRTPLTGMLGMLEVLSLSSLQKEQQEILDIAWESGRNLLRIVNDILDWSKIEAGALQLAPEATSIQLLMRDIINTYSSIASTKDLFLKSRLDSQLSAAYIVDPLRLSQVLNNFISNALKFTSFGSIKLNAEMLEHTESGDTIRFSVKDSGIGIPVDAQDYIFDRYRQESIETARMYGGTGLGLSICRRLADLMGGEIGLESEEGQGSIFYITLTLPVSAEPGKLVQSLHPEIEQKTVTPLFNMDDDLPTVLAVDDHPVNRNLLEMQFKLLGLPVETVENGQLALFMWQQGNYDLLVTDCHMPVMDGYQLTQEIRQKEKEGALKHTVIIGWTANVLGEEFRRCMDAGIDDLLAKPSQLKQLKDVLIKWLPDEFNDNMIDVVVDENESNAPTIWDNGPIDISILSQFAPDSAAQVKVLHDFQAHILTDYKQLLELVELADVDGIRSIAHRMKGSCKMVGAAALARACETIEQAAQSEDITTIDAGKQLLELSLKQFEIYFIELGESE